MTREKTLVLFDFDGTITFKDSLPGFLQYMVGKPKYYKGLFFQSPVLMAYTLNLVSNHVAKEKFIGYFFKTWDVKRFKKLATHYSLQVMPKLINPDAMNRINQHQKQGHHVVIVSATLECYLKPWCEENNIALIGTRLDSCNELLSGEFATKNCYGEEKVNRVKERFDTREYTQIIAYGDSAGDKQLLEFADIKFFRPF
jgi:phosphatidylglycerophosphatase C